MSALDLSNADFAALLQLAESQFYAWQLKEVQPERERRISELRKRDITIGGRAIYAMEIYRELLEREVRRRIGFYAQAAHDSGNREMLSKKRLEEYKERVMTTVGVASMALKDRVKREAHAAGWPESSLPSEHRYVQLQSEILSIVNTELRVLEAEGNLRDRGAYTPPVAPTDASKGTESASQKSDQPSAVEAQGPKGSRKAKNPIRRNQKYKVIDAALNKVAASRPSTQKEVFQSLDARHVVIPTAEPFKTGRGWIAGFRRDPSAARAWLSKRWAELDLPPLPRGPKNPKKYLQ